MASGIATLCSDADRIAGGDLPSQDDGTRIQCRTLRQERDDFWNRENEVTDINDQLNTTRQNWSVTAGHSL